MQSQQETDFIKVPHLHESKHIFLHANLELMKKKNESPIFARAKRNPQKKQQKKPGRRVRPQEKSSAKINFRFVGKERAARGKFLS